MSGADRSLIAVFEILYFRVLRLLPLGASVNLSEVSRPIEILLSRRTSRLRLIDVGIDASTIRAFLN